MNAERVLFAMSATLFGVAVALLAAKVINRAQPVAQIASNECRPGLVRLVTTQGLKDLCIPGYEVDK